MPFARILLPFLAFAVAAVSARADDGFMTRPRTVQNRRHALSGANELSLSVGASIKNKLTEHYGASLAYTRHFSEMFALEVFAEGGMGQLTGLVDNIRAQARLNKPTAMTDLADAGALLGTAQLGLKFTPVYGKVNLSAELPVHFNMYVVAGAGGAFVTYNSILACAADLPPGTNTCPANAGFQKQTTPTLGVNAGGGFRFFAGDRFSARVEVRDIMFPDRFNQDIDLRKAKSVPGKPVGSPGITHNPLVMLGVDWILR